ncbi:N-6 DNA methylase [Desulfofundulus thermobenzoicus]|uniref:site-specific DNA-methyltransferase (adenine-specific) n=1 Tax=Desulfofundulus thermobenzoicus TaxID=29376 RepID=A0A6N7ILJ5_9FIRM|nr:N-6 DNA methylase [Desulfofundulus thermobenzoicus]MQL50850.1 N-6 DNA methylase [Desulfofundulus thermobenzoicus]
MRFPCLKVEGGLLAPDLLDRIYEGAAPGQRPADFGQSGRLENEIAAAWQEALEHWQAFQHRLERLPEADPATTVTRDQWVIPLLSLLGYELVYTPRAAAVEGRTYAISHRAGTGEDALPVHVVGCRLSLDRRPETGRPRLAPHSLVQEYLNRTEQLWGVVTNGFTLRLLRDNLRRTQPAYIEFDLREMMAGKNFADFSLFYRLAHRSRLPKDGAADCWLERYYLETVEQGSRVRDRLRDGVEEAIKILGRAFLQHPSNEVLREKVHTNRLGAAEYYQQLLRLIYRLLFLMVAEERGLLTTNAHYRAYYSVARLRRLCENRRAYTDHGDLWESAKVTFRLLARGVLGQKLGLPPLNGPLFEDQATGDLNDLHLTNRAFLEAIWYLSMYKENERAPWRRVNCAALDVEELGSVYESLLDLHPVITFTEGGLPDFALDPGTERKSTGSYYTPRALVEELVASALVPVMQERLAGKHTLEEKKAALLSIKVCDPACGSGHFLLAAARRLGQELARIASEADEPAPEEVRSAVREVIAHCIYGVDKNPMAVELCQVALWIEGHAPGKPLTFLDHRIRCGDSLVGVLDKSVLARGIPDEAYDAVAGDEKAIARSFKRRNREERENPISFAWEGETGRLPDEHRKLSLLPDDTLEQVRQKAELYRAMRRRGSTWWQKQTACHLWTAAFFAQLSSEAVRENRVPTSDTLFRQLENRAPDPRAVGTAWELAQKHRFFHWPLEFPEVFAQGGFDVVLCNPPWEQIQLEEKEFFAVWAPEVARALNKAARQRLINRLPEENPPLWQEYQGAKHTAEATSKFLRGSGRFPLTARGRINTYSVFAELFSQLLRPGGRAGVVLPTGIATDDTNKHFFAYLVESGRLVSLYDFENREGIFSAVDSRYKFSLLTMRGRREEKTPARFAFFLTNTDHLHDSRRVFELSPEELVLFNPNTRTCPVFRTMADAELTKKIYQRVPVLVNERTGENPWKVSFEQGIFNMSTDSHLFRTTQELEEQGYVLMRGRDLGRPDGLCYVRGDEIWLPLYEAKMIWQFDHRFGTYKGVPPNTSSTHLPTPREEDYADPDYFVLPRYWVSEEEVEVRLEQWKCGWLLSFRRVARANDERTGIFSIILRSGVGDSLFLLLIMTEQRYSSCLNSCLLVNLNSLVFDYFVRQKVAGTNMSFYFVRQLPVLPPDAYTESDLFFIVPRVLELVYTAWDLEAFAREVWQDCPRELRQEIARRWQECCGRALEAQPGVEEIPPFRWDPGRRAIIRAELDAYYAKLYGLTRDELRYILDPRDVFGPDFPGETFRVLKEKEERQYGEYRTRRLVLESWERLNL